jgi:hypothetical protein
VHSCHNWLPILAESLLKGKRAAGGAGCEAPHAAAQWRGKRAARDARQEIAMDHPVPTDRFASFSEFYPFYLGEHRNVVCRRLHFIGSLGVIGCVAMALAMDNWLWLPAALVCGYGFAWIGHFFFEKNRPATFRHPLYSLIGDWVMFKDICTGKISI